jgi:hypothetical protein
MSASALKVFPNIKRAALEIAYDNGMINRQELELDFIRSVNERLEAMPVIKLAGLEGWLAGLDQQTFQTACVGEHNDMMEVMKTAPDPEFAEKALNVIFGEEEV